MAAALATAAWLAPHRLMAQEEGDEGPAEAGDTPPSRNREGETGDTPPSRTRDGGKPSIVPPRLLTIEPVPYPDEGTGDTIVVLEVLVNADGSVGEITVVEGEAPFADAAVAAAREWRFEPARVEGRARAARIRIPVEFRQSRERERERDAPPDPQQKRPNPRTESVPVAPAADTASVPIEVSVVGEKDVPGRTSLGKVEIRELPGAFGDPFRAIDALPGVTPLVSGLPFFFIRGSPPGNQGYFFDGVRVPLLYHLGLGPGVIHPELVERVDLYPGGYPARYGRFVGGIVAAESAPPAAQLHGHANIRLIDSGGLIHAPFAGGRGTATAAGRYSYTARIIQLIEPDIRLQYWDYQLRTRWEGQRDGAWELFWFGSFDLYREDDDYRLGTEFHRVDMRRDFVTPEGTEGRVAVTVGVDRTREEELEANNAGLRDRIMATRLELEHQATPERRHRGGADFVVTRHDTSWDDFFEDEESTPLSEELQMPSRTDYAVGVWSDIVLDVTPRIALVLGGRTDLYVQDGVTRFGLDPRAAATFTVREGVRLVHAFGIVHQPPSFLAPVPGFNLSDLEDGLQRSAQSSAGIELDLAADWETSLTLFQQAAFNGTDVLSTASREDAEFDIEEDIAPRSLGHTYGAELWLRRSFENRVGGFVAYTLSRSTRSTGRFHGASSFDRTHVLNAALSFDLGRSWRAGTRFVFYTGAPVEVELDTTDDERTRFVEVRTQPYYRFDWRIQKRWRIGSSGAWWAFTAEVLNTTLHREEVSPACPDGSCDATRIGPVTVPAIGVEAAF